jgi:hypothetical protein
MSVPVRVDPGGDRDPLAEVDPVVPRERADERLRVRPHERADLVRQRRQAAAGLAPEEEPRRAERAR